MSNLLNRLKQGGSLVAIVAATSFTANSASAQPAAPAAIEEVTVTGTNIRGAAPVGSNLVTVGTADIVKSGATNLQEVLATVPSLSQMGSRTSGTNPNIHQLGGSASSSTLVIVDGFRFPLGSTSHSLPDPSILPTMAVERVEVLADGSSSIYGSDAIAGVINFITRKGYDGTQINAAAGFADGYSKYDLGVLWGTAWKSGSAMVVAEYQNESILLNSARPNITMANHTSQGGSNSATFNCAPATIQPNGAGNIYLSATATTSVANVNANQTCDQSQYGTLVPADIRYKAMFKVTQDFGNRLTLHTDLIYAQKSDYSVTSRGTISGGTVYGAGAQANPFYTNPPGVTATKQTIRFDANDLLGPGAYSIAAATTILGHFGGEYKINDDFTVDFGAAVGQDVSTSNSFGSLCASCAALALNGTTNLAGSTTTVSIPGTNVIVQGLPLTAANAIDVWNPAATNRTSAATKANLVNNTNITYANNSFEQYRASVNGSLFDLPAGPVRAAVGAEHFILSLIQTTSKGNNTGPTTTGSALNVYRFGRIVDSAFAEARIPLISPEAGIPLVQKFDVDLSVRYDHYSDEGPTTNPKYAFGWEVIDGLKLRGNYSTSFVAPQLDSVGDPNQGYNAVYSHVNTYNSPTITFPTANYPGVAGVLPGCAATAVTCQIGTSTLPGIDTQRGGGATLKNSTGAGYSFGADFNPDFLPGLTVNATFFDQMYRGGVTSPTQGAQVNSKSLNDELVICPTGCTAAQIATATAGVPVTGALPLVAYLLRDDNQRNVINLDISGIDLATQYDFDTNFGHITVGDALTEFLMYKESFGTGGPKFNAMNETGFNTTFPSVQTQMRAHLGWEMNDLEADFFWNFNGSYRNWNSTAVALLTPDANGNPIGGGDKVDSNSTFDLHVAYTFANGFFGEDLAGSQVYVDAKNIFDKAPPFYNGATAFDATQANPIGRIITIGLQARLGG